MLTSFLGCLTRGLELLHDNIAAVGIDKLLHSQGFRFRLSAVPIVCIVVPFLVKQNLYYRILTIKLVNQKKELQWRL